MRYPSEAWFRNKYGEPEEPMTNDQIIHEARGLHWHTEIYVAEEDNSRGWTYLCTSCMAQSYLGFDNPDYSKWENYGPMLEWATTQEWWTDEFIMQYQACEDVWDDGDIAHLLRVLLNPLRGRDAIAEFLKEQKL